jgi:hypothetical protein
MTKYDEYINKSNECIKRYKKYIDDNKDVYLAMFYNNASIGFKRKAVNSLINSDKNN